MLEPATILFRARVSVLGTAAAVPFPSFPPSPPDLFFGSCSPCSASTYASLVDLSRAHGFETKQLEIASVQLDFPSALYYSPRERNSFFFFFFPITKKRRTRKDDSLNSIDLLRGNVTKKTCFKLSVKSRTCEKRSKVSNFTINSY